MVSGTPFDGSTEPCDRGYLNATRVAVNAEDLAAHAGLDAARLASLRRVDTTLLAPSDP